jgi:hypothetical protein
MAREVSRCRPDATVLCAVARQGSLEITPADHAWAHRVEEAFAGQLELIGVHLVTLDGSLPIPMLDQAA